ncbi:MAG: hypothetical protein V1793_23455 [Pseudomonadota bacterium]
MITRIESYTQLAEELSGNKTNAAGGDLFQKALTKAISGTQTQEESQPAAASSSSLGEIVSVGCTPVLAETNLQDTTDDLIRKLDNYSSQLGDSTTSLRNLASSLEDINASAKKLLQEAESSNGADDRLLFIARESAIKANAEYIKFQRGDYL